MHSPKIHRQYHTIIDRSYINIVIHRLKTHFITSWEHFQIVFKFKPHLFKAWRVKVLVNTRTHIANSINVSSLSFKYQNEKILINRNVMSHFYLEEETNDFDEIYLHIYTNHYYKRWFDWVFFFSFLLLLLLLYFSLLMSLWIRMWVGLFFA